jgi:hypothetical protein
MIQKVAMADDPFTERRRDGFTTFRPTIEPPAGRYDTLDEDRITKDQPAYSRWTGEPLGEAAGQTQKGGIGQSH